jgi:hypothetical protein
LELVDTSKVPNTVVLKAEYNFVYQNNDNPWYSIKAIVDGAGIGSVLFWMDGKFAKTETLPRMRCAEMLAATILSLAMAWQRASTRLRSRPALVLMVEVPVVHLGVPSLNLKFHSLIS